MVEELLNKLLYIQSMEYKVYDLNYIKTIHTHTHTRKRQQTVLWIEELGCFYCLLPTMLYFPNVLYNGQVCFISSEKNFFKYCSGLYWLPT